MTDHAQPKTILLVEDEAIIAMQEARQLKEEGYAVVTALCGEEAIKTVQAAAPPIDLILIDLDLGKGRMDGARTAQSILQTHDIPIVVLSSHTDPDTVNRAEQITSYGYVVKGTGAAVLAAALSMAFKLHATHQSLKCANEKLEQEIAERKRTEEALQRERDLLQIMMNNPRNVHLVYLDTGFNFVRVSEAYAATCGYRAEEMVGRNHFALYPHPENEAIFTRVRDTGKPFEVRDKPFEFPDQPGRGVTYWDWTLTPEKDRTGRVTGLIFALVETTGRKEAELALRRSEEAYRCYFEMSTIGMCVTSLEKGWLQVNDRLCAMMGYSREELQRMTWEEMTHPDDLAADVELFKQVLAGARDSYELEKRFLRRDGNTLNVLLCVNCQRDPTGAVRYFLASLVDITERTQAEEQRKLLLKRLNLATRAAGLGIWDWDIQKNQLVWDKQMYALYGVRSQDFAGAYEAWLAGVHPDDRAASDETSRKARLGEREYETEFRILWPDGSVRFLKAIGEVMRDASGQPVRMVGVNYDITAGKKAEAALRASEERFASAFAYAAIGMALVSPEGRFLKVNRAVCDILGYTESELLARTFQDISHPDDLNSDLDSVRRMLAGEIETYQMEKRYVHERGHEVWALLSVSLVWDKPGKPLYFVSQIQDITKRKRAQEALRQSEERFRSLVESAPEAVFVQIEGRFVYLNPGVTQLLGARAPEELLGKSIMERIAPEFQEAVRKRIRFQRETRQAAPLMEQVYLRLDGSPVPVETTAVVMEYQGCPAHLVFVRDISERKRAEVEQSRLVTAVEQAAETIMVTDPQGTIQYVNPAFERISGYTRAEALGQNPRLLKSGKQEAEFYRRMWDTLSQGQVWKGHFFNRRKDGTLYEEEATISPVRDGTGKIVNFVSVKHDVTREVQLESQLRQAQKMEAIGTLASGISHDLNNLLAPMLMISGLLKDKLVDEEDRKLLVLLQQEAKRGGDIVKQLLLFSRGLEGALALVQPRYALREFVNLMRETFPREIEIRQSCSSEVWPILADQTQFHQLLLNLCVNARDAMPNGGTLTVRLRNVTLKAGDPVLPPSATAGAYLHIEVTDTGHGIPPEIRDRIFDPFFTTKPIGQGSGLGLSTVHGIAHKTGGFVTVGSELGKGSVFGVYWPAVPEQVAAESAQPETAAPSGQDQLILVVDDERSIREATRIVLERHGYRVQLAVNGEDALAHYRRNRENISLVLTDIMMPVMNGVALVTALRESAPHLPIIATSGLGSIDRRAELTALGVTEFLMKPCSTAVLLAAVHRQIALLK